MQRDFGAKEGTRQFSEGSSKRIQTTIMEGLVRNSIKKSRYLNHAVAVGTLKLLRRKNILPFIIP